MLLSLSLVDFVLVERLDLDFKAGFSVLTGETGAGKSILLDALSLVLGERADAGAIREGAQRSEVSAEFSLDDVPGLAAWLDENDLAETDGGLLMRRVVENTGRSRAFINGRPATAQQMKQAGEFLVDIHGQHAHYSLLKSAEQRRLLDSYGCGGAVPTDAASEIATDVALSWRDWCAARARREAAEQGAGVLDAERERLTWVVQELAPLEFTLEGWQTLQEDHKRLAHAAELAAGAQTAAAALEAEDAGVLQQLRSLRADLAELAEIDPSLGEQVEMLAGAADTLHETARELNRYADRVDLDPEALNQAEMRLTAVQAAVRKFRIRPEEIPEYLGAARVQLDQLGTATDLEALGRAEREAEAAYQRLAARLSKSRVKAAVKLGKAVTDAMQQLAMQGGCFEVGLIPGEPAAHGLEEVEFRVSPHAGQSVKPLAKTASGGELSRIGLALQTVLSSVSGAPTLIFDEVDAGIGGGVAEIVGRLLAGLGASRQVLCVTHLPQVAACAGQHYQVSKNSRNGKAVSHVLLLEPAMRVEEIARMLGGVAITEATRAHALEMLAS